MITFGGGILLEDSSRRIIGASGVSGSTVEYDVKVAEAGAEVCRTARWATASWALRTGPALGAAIRPKPLAFAIVARSHRLTAKPGHYPVQSVLLRAYHFHAS